MKKAPLLLLGLLVSALFLVAGLGMSTYDQSTGIILMVCAAPCAYVFSCLAGYANPQQKSRHNRHDDEED